MYNQSELEKSEFYISVANILNKNNIVNEAGNFPYDYKYGREAGNIQQYVKRVPFSRKTISEEVLERLKSKIPKTFELIKAFNRSSNKTEYLSDEEKI